MVAGTLRGQGVDLSRLIVSDEGQMGLAFLEYLPEGRNYQYYRKNSVGSLLRASELDAEYISGAYAVHFPGMLLELTEEMRGACERLVEIAREKGILVSFDPNIRRELSADAAARARLLWAVRHDVKALHEVCEDSFKRLIFPSLERELRAQLTEKACAQAIGVFSENLQNLLMQPPVKGCVTMGFDPAYRTGCKIAVVDETGKVLDTTVVYPTPPQNRTEQAKQVLGSLIEKYGITVIAIGNGTASKESEIFVAELLSELNPKLEHKVSYMVVSEAGASVYSASKLGAEEFPQFDVSLRSAVSIARRLQDPLAELVKIDPKAIGVGQYQHDMPPKEMDAALGGVVEDCVNKVGVDLNTASQSLLSYVAGINAAVAKNIVLYREENGSFTKRSQLLSVSKLGKKAYEQCAGFLRVSESENPFDHTGVHPESYEAAKQLLTLCGYQMQDVLSGEIAQLPERVQALGGTEQTARRIGVGEPTLKDMMEELLKPGRDPRDELPKPLLRTDVMEMKDLKPDMILTGTVRNVTDFGAFVDIAVHEDGLVHLSQICDRYIKHPSEVLKVGDIVKVKVLDVDLKRKRISLTMKGLGNQTR